MRNQLRARGLMEFCDEAPERVPPSQRRAVPASPAWAAQVQAYPGSLLAAGVHASSTDHLKQSIGNTLEPDTWGCVGVGLVLGGFVRG